VQEDNVQIRRAGREDAAALAALCGELGYPTEAATVQTRLERVLDDPGHAVFVADGCGGIVGWVHALQVIYLEEGPFTEIGGLVVASSCRGEGIGARLMAAAEAWSLNQGIRLVRLRSNTIRERAHAFYRRLGYEITKSQYAFRKLLTVEDTSITLDV
jgi:GNAT superfamily N-acetyltransferase